MAESDDARLPITHEMFQQGREPRFGKANPERMHVPLWERMVQEGRSLYWTRKAVGAERRYSCSVDVRERTPDWTWQRLGQSVTPLPNGRTIHIGGEYEDWYDDDFCIYNDAIVRDPDGGIEIFGYPREVFPPTDFHTATFIGDRIIIVGSLGYAQDRRPGETPVYEFDTETYTISRVETVGEAPGWLSNHTAVLDPKAQTITFGGGEIIVRRGEACPLREYYGRARLHLDGMRWERLSVGESWRHFKIKLPREENLTPDSQTASAWMDTRRREKERITGLLESGSMHPGLRQVAKPDSEPSFRGEVQGMRMRIDPGMDEIGVVFETGGDDKEIDLTIARFASVLGGSGPAWSIQED